MNNEKTYENIETLCADIRTEIIKIYSTCKCLALTESNFIIVCEDILRELYNNDKNMTLEKYIEMLKRNIEEYIITKYISNVVKTSRKNTDNVEILRKLDEFLNLNRIEQTPELYEHLLKNNIINEIVANTINNNLVEIKEKGLDRLYNNNNIILLLEMYCENNDISYKSDIKELLKNGVSSIECQSLDSLGLYLTQISKKLLTKEEEKRLFELKEQGDEKAIEKIAEHNLLLVVHIAKSYVGKGLDILDLIQEGNLGLMTAINKFDYSKGYKLSTYATWWIRQSIQRSIMNNSKLIRLPVHVFEKINKYSEVTRNLEKKLDRTPTKKEICEEMNITLEQFHELERATQNVISINTIIGEENDSDTELGDYIASDDESLEEQYFKSTLPEEIMHILDRINLTEREKYVLLERCGFESNNPKTLEEIAKKIGITRERVRQIEAKALRKIRISPYLKRLALLSNSSLDDNIYIKTQAKRKTLK